MRIIFARLAVTALVGISAAALPKFAAADAVSDFYKNKEIRVIIGYPPGGGYDVYARLVARYIARHIPGHPTVVPQNMPGAGSIVAVQYLIKIAPRDGTVLGTISQYLPLDQIAADLTNTYDVRNLNWIGNPDESNAVTPVWAASGIKTIQDAMTKEVVVGASGSSGAGALYPRVLNNTVGTMFKIITGYAGSSQLDLAMARGEIEGRGSDSWSALKAAHPDWIESHKINILLQFGVRRESDLPNVPLMTDIARNSSEKRLFQMMSTNSLISYPLVTTPGVPADRLKALRTAFEKTMKDPEFLKQAAEQKLSIDPVSGEALADAVDKVVDAPQDVIALFNASLRSGKMYKCMDFENDKSACKKAKQK